MKKYPLLWLIFVLLTSCLIAQNNQKAIAVLDLDPTGITERDAQFLSDRLRTELFETGAFTVVEREKMNEILTEQGFQTSGCTSLECAVEIGRLLNVQQIVAGNIGKIDEMYSIGLRLIDVQSGAIVKTATRDYEGRLSEVLVDIIPEVARILAEDKNEVATAAPDSSETEILYKYAAVLKFGWAFLAYTNTLNDEIDKFAKYGNEIRLENFPQHAAFTIEGKYAFSRDWQLKIGVCIENMTSEWRNEFAEFPSEIPEIKNLTDISITRKFSFTHLYIGVDYTFWRPGKNQEWYIGADIGNLLMESKVNYSYDQDLNPRTEESTTRYNNFALKLCAGFNYHLSKSLYLGLELGAQLAAEYDLSSEVMPTNFPTELEPIVFPKKIAGSGLLVQLTGGYRF